MRAGLENRVEVFGSQGCLVADRFRGLRAQLLPPQRRVWDYLESIPAAAHTLIQLPRFMQRLASPWGEPSYRRSLQHLIDCMVSGREPRPNAEDGYQCLRVVEAAREAIRRGETSYLR